MATATPAVKRKRSSLLEWGLHREEIERLYLKESKSLPSVMETMLRDHAFDASKGQYEAQFKVWGFRKNAKKNHWRYAYFMSRERKETGKDSLIYLNAALIPVATTKKEFRRHVPLTEQYMPAPSLPSCPEGLFVCTPPETALYNLRIDNLPWVYFRRSIESQLKSVNFGINLAELACQFSIISSDAPSPSAPSFGLEFFEDFGDEWLAELTPSEPQRSLPSPAIAKGAFLTFDTSDPLALMTYTLNRFTNKVVTPEDYRRDLRTEWELQIALPDRDPVVRLLKTFVWLSSNNMLGISIHQDAFSFFDWIIDNIPASVLNVLLTAKIPTVQACIEHIFAHALRRGNLGLVRTLLAKRSDLVRVLGSPQPVDAVIITGGSNITRTYHLSRSFDELFTCALRLDDFEIVRGILSTRDDAGQKSPLWNAQSPEMAEMLLTAGADVNALHLIPLENVMHSMTTLVWAILCGKTAIVQLLIRNKADVNLAARNLSENQLNVETTYGMTPLRAAIDRAVRAFKRWGDHEDNANDELELTRILLEAGADVNAPSLGQHDIRPSRFGLTTALQVSARAGHKSLSKLLLNAGAEVNTPPYPMARTALLGAVESGDGEMVKMLLQRGAVVDAPSCHELEHQETCLMSAIERGDATIVKILLEAGADCNIAVRNRFGLSSIEVTKDFTKNSEIMQLLLQFGARQDKEGQQRAQLIHAISRRDSAGVRSIINTGIVLTEPDGFRSKILREAIEWGDQSILLALIQAGIDVNKTFEANQEDFILQGRYGSRSQSRLVASFGPLRYITPLGYAIIHERLRTETRLAIVSMLLDANADPNASLWPEEYRIQPPLHFVVDLWIERRREGHGSQEDFFEPLLIRTLLDKGASANGSGYGLSSPFQETVLQLIAADPPGSKASETLKITEILLEAGVDVNVTGCPNGCYPIQAATLWGNFELVKLLLRHNADINAPALESGGTALQTAIMNLSRCKLFGTDGMAIVDFLLSNGANINAPPASDTHGGTALQSAVIGKEVDLVGRLIDLGADVNAAGPDQNGGSAVAIAAASGSLEIAHILIDAEADINAVNGEGYTAFELAAAYGRLDMVQLLINAGADTNLVGSERYRRAEDFARENGYVTVANLLKDRFEDEPED